MSAGSRTDALQRKRERERVCVCVCVRACVCKREGDLQVKLKPTFFSNNEVGGEASTVSPDMGLPLVLLLT